MKTTFSWTWFSTTGCCAANVLINLKRGKIAIRTWGRCSLYVNCFDHFVKTAEENSTIGIVLCKQKTRRWWKSLYPRPTYTRGVSSIC